MRSLRITEKPESVAEERRDRGYRILFFLLLALLTLTRLWLTRKEDIVAIWLPHDDTLYADLGEHAFWWRASDDLSMLRLPVYPLWIWLCYQIGLPLYVGTTLLAVCAWLFLIYALRQIHIPRVACVAVYASQLFEINAIHSFRRVTPDVFYGILFIAAASSILLVLKSQTDRQRWIPSAGLGALLTLFAATRAESALCWVLFLLFVTAFILQHLVSHGGTLPSLRVLSSAALLPAIGLTAAPLTVALANKRAFGVFTFCSLTSASFTSAMNQLLKIKPDNDMPYVPVSRGSRMKAYAVSPACAKLQPLLEGRLGAGWGRFAMERYRVPVQEIGGGWFFFAFRDAVAEVNAGSPTKINAYYQKITRELRQAFKEGKLPRRRLWLSLMQPDRTILRRIPAAFGKILKQIFSPRPPGDISSWVANLETKPVAEQIFNRVTNRRSLLPVADTMTVSGWAFSNAQPLVSVLAWKKDGRSLPISFKNSPQPAVYGANKAEFPSLRPELPFAFSAAISQQRKTEIDATKFIFGDNTVFSICTAKLQPGRFEISKAGRRTGWLEIDAITHTPGNVASYEAAARQLAVVTEIYALLFKTLIVVTIPGLAVLLVVRRSPRHNTILYCWLIPVFGFIVARVAVLALIDASSFYGAASRFLVPVAGPLAGGLILLVAQAVVVRGRFASKFPWR
jgi:hypothetical protein